MSALKKGFTLIELVIVIAVLGVLSGVVISVINPEKYRNRAQDARREADLSAIQGALEVYFADNQSYPIHTSAVASSDATAWASLLTSDYISAMPVDPDNDDGKYYYYISDSDGLDYELDAVLEEGSMSSDGGNSDTRYEVGTDLSLL